MKKGDKNRSLGAYIRTRRLAQGIDIRTAAEHSGLDGSYWRKLEAGHYRNPDPKHLRVIADTISCPLEDLYTYCGYAIPAELPTLTPYLRTKYDLPPEAAADMERYFAQLRSYYGIPDDQPVFPPVEPEPRPAPKRSPSSEARNASSHPWRAAQDRGAS